MFFTYPLVLGAILELLHGRALVEAGSHSTIIENEIEHNLIEYVSGTMLRLIEIESHNYREEIKLIRGNLPFYKNLLKIWQTIIYFYTSFMNKFYDELGKFLYF